MQSSRDPLVWHLLVVLAVSVAYESLFLHHGINVVDEGWPLYAAMRLHAGGALYGDVFFVFPPGHLLVAWIAYGLDPPGVVLARALYASLSVALSVGVYLLGRRVAAPTFAFIGALLLAIGATSAHMQQLVFGYRYLVVSLLALLAFAEWQRTGDRRWIFGAGLLTGLALVFRLTPAFAAGCAIGIGVIAAGGTLRAWLRDWTAYGIGIVLVAAPVIGWFLASVGPETLWLEAVVRPVAMTDMQSLPMPDLAWWPVGSARKQISDWFVAIQFRAWTLLYIAYAMTLATLWVRAIAAGKSFAHPVLTAIVVWGGVYYLRSFGRSDSAHLYSAIPPVCLLLGHAVGLAARSVSARVGAAARVPMAAAAFVVGFGLWIFLIGSDRPLDPSYRGETPLSALDGRVSVRKTSSLRLVDRKVKTIKKRTKPGDTILDLSASSLFHPLTGRLGPGYADIIMPGTFLTDEEEIGFLERLRANPPALVIWPGQDFDKMPGRSARESAPRVVRWVRRNYEIIGKRDRFTLMLPRERLRPGEAGAG